MAGRVYEADLTVPAGTARNAPVTAVWALDQGTLVSVRIVVPPGHGGLTGIRVRWATTPIIPYAGSDYIVADNEKMEWDINQEVNIGQITVQGFNTDVWPHTFYLRGLLVGPSAVIPAAITALPASGPPAADALAAIATISSPGDLAPAPGLSATPPVDRARLSQHRATAPHTRPRKVRKL